MVQAIIGLVVIFLFGLYIGHAPQSKWPWMEVLVASIVALVLVSGGLLWAQKSQGACAPVGYKDPYGDACKSILTLKNATIGYSGYLIGLVTGLCYQMLAHIGTRRNKAHVKK